MKKTILVTSLTLFLAAAPAMAQMMGQMAGTGSAQAGTAAAAVTPEIMTLSEAALYMRVGEEDVLEHILGGVMVAQAPGGDGRACPSIRRNGSRRAGCRGGDSSGGCSATLCSFRTRSLPAA